MRENSAAGMEDEIAALRQQVDVAAQSLSHAALDAIAFMGLAQHLAGGEPNAWGRRSAQLPGIGGCCGARNQLIDADCRLRLAA